MKHITFLGPIGATFSHNAYNALSDKYSSPVVNQKNYITANSNNEILNKIIEHGGYGAIAMETLAEGRVAEPLESFIELLQIYTKTADCPIRIVGAIQMKLHFCLMVKPGLSMSNIKAIIAHPKALGACENKISELGVQTISVASNGEAARLVAKSDEYASFAALGPQSASEKYGLKILNKAFEDSVAMTTFFLVAPASHKVKIGKNNRVLIVFKVPHEPGSLAKVLQTFAQENLNLIQIHSVHVGNHNYNFVIEIEVKKSELDSLHRAMNVFEKYVKVHILFGPFEVHSD